MWILLPRLLITHLLNSKDLRVALYVYLIPVFNIQGFIYFVQFYWIMLLVCDRQRMYSLFNTYTRNFSLQLITLTNNF